MSRLLDVFVSNLLPVFLSAGAGVAVGRAFRPDIKTVTRLSFYIFSPCLVFSSLTNVAVSGAEFGQLTAFTLAVVVAMALLAAGLGLALRLDRRTLATLIVAAAFVNSGNYGLAATRFAFGEAALARAVIFYTISTISVYTLGILVASLGGQNLRGALREIVSVPPFYAVIAAGLIRGLDWPIPLFLERSIGLLGDAAIPVMLVLLGLQMAAIRPQAEAWPRRRLVVLGIATVLQLLVAPLVALAAAGALGLSGVTWQAAVLEASMPAAVITTVLALQYDLDAELMTIAVVVTTVLSPLTLTPLIAYLQAGL